MLKSAREFEDELVQFDVTPIQLFNVLDFKHSGVDGNLCINTKGLWFLYEGKCYELDLLDNMPQVLLSIIQKYMFDNCKYATVA